MIDLKNRMAQAIKHSEKIKKYYPDGIMPYEIFLDTFSSQMVEKECLEQVREFMNLDNMEQHLKDESALSLEYHGNQIEWGRIVLAPAKWSPDGRLEKVVFAVQDITEQKCREEWMQYKMEHDELTGTLNRTAFNKVTKLLEDSVTPFALVILDIDRFKEINDTYGHEIGDLSIKTMAKVMQQSCPDSSYFCIRYGGDEFLMMGTCDSEEAAASIQCDMEKRIRASVPAGDVPVKLSASIGYILTSQSDTERSLDEYISQADQMMYRIKKSGSMTGDRKKERAYNYPIDMELSR